MRVLVVGAGVAGLTLALCLARDRHEVLVVERSPGPRAAGYMIDFFGSGYDVGERLGLLTELQAVHYPITSLSFLAADGTQRFAIPYEAMRRLLGGRHFNFMRGDLERLLLDALPDRAVVRFGMSIHSCAHAGTRVDVRLRDGSTERVDLLVGADGLHSRVRDLALGKNRDCVRPLGYHTAAFVVDDPKLRSEIGDTFATMTVPGRQVALYPIRGSGVATFWVHRSEADVGNTSPRAAARELRSVYGGLGWLIPRVLDRADESTDIYFDTVSQVVLPKWSRGRIVLLGDACQCVSLLAGQGASMAVGAAYVLAEELKRAPDVETALAQYERRIRPAILRKQRAGRGIARWFVPESGVRLAIRDRVLRMSASPLGGWLLRRQISGESVIS